MTELAGLELGDAPAVWERLGFAVRDGRCRVGATELRLTGAGGGIAAWTLRGDARTELDGLPTQWTSEPAAAREEHPNGALKLDHVVISTPDLQRTFAALEAAGLELRRVREAGEGRRQGFFRLGETLLEVVGPAGEETAFWGLVVVVDDLDALAERLGDDLGAAGDAVQPGRRIATVRRSAGSGVPIAFMSKRIQ